MPHRQDSLKRQLLRCYQHKDRQARLQEMHDQKPPERRHLADWLPEQETAHRDPRHPGKPGAGRRVDRAEHGELQRERFPQDPIGILWRFLFEGTERRLPEGSRAEEEAESRGGRV